MSEHFIKNIEIKNYKLFKDFKAEGFGRVNLIGGKNNVGKTAFMEACYISSTLKENDNSLKFLFPLLTIQNLRTNLNDNEIYLIQDVKNVLEKFNSALILENSKNKFNLNIKKDGFINKIEFNNNDIGELPEKLDAPFQMVDEKNINFIPSFMTNNTLLKNLYNEIIEQRKGKKLNQVLNKFDKNIEDFSFIKEIPKVFLTNIDTWQDISELGHGLKRYIAIICSILINKDGCLFLDEIENGIHYTQLDRLWEIILTISKEQNVQVFATTHSKECIESYARVAKRLEDKEITFVELCKREEEIKAFVYHYDWFLDEIEQEHEVRGCL